jgi:hypothetical protein
VSIAIGLAAPKLPDASTVGDGFVSSDAAGHETSEQQVYGGGGVWLQ